MSQPTPPRRGWLAYAAVAVVSAAATAAALALLANIRQRKAEGEQTYVKLADVDEDTIDPAVWGRNFPRQYDTYRRTVDQSHTRHGGSEAESHLEKNPRLKRLFAGYAFSIDYREARGHAYMLSDQDATERVKQVKQPGACLHCHASVMPAYRKLGDGDERKGFEKMCAMPLTEARKQVDHPVSCVDCHDPKTMQVRVTRPAFLAGIAALAKGDAAVPHLPSVERWRQKKREKDYDPNVDASRQELRSFVCGQCHVEYYFKGDGKVVTYPWARGLTADAMEGYYDAEGFWDWVHAETGAKVIKAQHPEFETWSQGVHARSGVACADCHVPYVRDGATKVSDHQVRSPMLNVARACQVCHRYDETEIVARVRAIQDRTKGLMARAEGALVEFYDAFAEAKKAGAPEARLEAARKLQRKAQWRADFVNAENSRGFHAPQETARVLAEAIDYARLAQLELAKK